MSENNVGSVSAPLHAIFSNQSDQPSNNVLGRIRFGNQLDLSGGENEPPLLTVPMMNSVQKEFLESWVGGTSIKYGLQDELAFAEDGEFLFIAATLLESSEYAKAAESCYRKIFSLVEHLGYPRLFRIWNYIGHILTPLPSGLQVYQDFAKGRAHAFMRSGGTPIMPAATGIGTNGDGIGIIVLSSRTGITKHIENPRQKPAYEYPRKYGPKPPSFARATALTQRINPTECAQFLFVSGTASIVGHESVHPGDFTRQLSTTLDNLESLVDGSNLTHFGAHGHFTLKDAHLMKVYVKYASDIEEARQKIRHRVGINTDVQYINVDICRDELLVEIEVVFPCIKVATER